MWRPGAIGEAAAASLDRERRRKRQRSGGRAMRRSFAASMRSRGETAGSTAVALDVALFAGVHEALTQHEARQSRCCDQREPAPPPENR